MCVCVWGVSAEIREGSCPAVGEERDNEYIAKKKKKNIFLQTYTLVSFISAGEILVHIY